jgi:hypothetical protein
MEKTSLTNSNIRFIELKDTSYMACQDKKLKKSKKTT